jgi:hypothetical protein
MRISQFSAGQIVVTLSPTPMSLAFTVLAVASYVSHKTTSAHRPTMSRFHPLWRSLNGNGSRISLDENTIHVVTATNLQL